MIRTPMRSASMGARWRSSPSAGEVCERHGVHDAFVVESAQERAGLAALRRVPLGLAILMVERVRAGVAAREVPADTDAAAFLIGIGDVALSTIGRATSAVVRAGRGPYDAVVASRGVLDQPILQWATAPARRLGAAVAGRVEETVVRGRAVAQLARTDAIAFLDAESETALAWVREQVLPPIIDDLVADPKVRALVVEQAHGALTDTAREVQRRSVSADARIEAGVRRLLGRDNSAHVRR